MMFFSSPLFTSLVPTLAPKLYHGFLTPYLPRHKPFASAGSAIFQLALQMLQDLAMKLSSSFSNPNAVTHLSTSFPSLSINPDTSSPLPISSSFGICSFFSTGCMLGHSSYTLCTCIQWLRMLISAFHVLPTVCTLSHDFQSVCVLSH